MAELDCKTLIVSTVVPALNEEGNIDEFCCQFADMAAKSRYRNELVFVDDGSHDGTLEKMQANAQKYDFVKYASHQRNRGLTEALQTGFAAASGEVYVFFPADLQYRPEDIPRLVEPVIKGADLCTGWKQGDYNKKFVSRIYNWFSRSLFGLKVHDLNSVKAFRREVIQNIFLRRDWHRYLVVLAANEGYRVEEAKVSVYEREWGQSKFSVWRIPVGVLDMVAVKFQLTFLRKPLLFFGLTGLAFLALAFVIGLYALYMRFVEGHGNRTFLYLVILLTSVGGGLFLLGFLSEGLTALKEEIGDLRRKNSSILERLSNTSPDDEFSG